MATYLALVQNLAAESGTADNASSITATAGLTRRNAKYARWVREAWRAIQNAHPSWLWMQSTFSGPTVASQREYTGVQMGVASRFGSFETMGKGEDRYSIYLTSTGVSDEGPLRFSPYDEFFPRFMRGTQTNGKPAWFTITPTGSLALHPTPDAIYTVRGPYRKDIQDLASDTDVPEMPTRFHDLIVEMGMWRLTRSDEATAQLPLYQLQKFQSFSELEHDQLPRVTLDLGGFA